MKVQERIQIHTRFARLRNELQIPFALYRCKVVVGIIYDSEYWSTVNSRPLTATSVCDQSISHPEHPSPDSDDLEDFLPPDPRPTYISTDHANRSTVRPDLSRDSQVSATLADVRTAPDPAVTKTKAYHAQESRRIAQPQVSANTDSRSEDIFSGLNRISPTGPIRKVAAVHNVQDIFSSLERQTPVGPIIRRRGGT